MDEADGSLGTSRLNWRRRSTTNKFN